MNNSFSNLELPVAVVVTKTSWDEPPRFRHQVTRQMTRFYNVVFVEKIYNNKSDYEQKISNRLLIYRPKSLVRVPLKYYSSIPVLHFLVNYCFKKKIDKYLRVNRFSTLVLLNFEFDFYSMMICKSFNFKAYICNDEFPKMIARYNNKTIKSFYLYTLFQFYESLVVKHANVCLAAHEPLVSKLKKYNSNTHLFLAGHENKYIRFIKHENVQGYPIKVGFMGFINYRLMKDWLLNIAQSKEMELYLIGPIEKDFDINDFFKFNNVFFETTLEGEPLINRMHKLDVMIIPFNPSIPEIEILTASNKLFQIVSILKPVVISNMPNYIRLPKGVLYVAHNKNDFIKKIKIAFKEDNTDLRKQRMKIANTNSWDIRGNKLKKYIDSGLLEAEIK